MSVSQNLLIRRLKLLPPRQFGVLWALNLVKASVSMRQRL